LKSLIIDYFHAGCEDDKYEEENRKIFILNFFSFGAMALTGVMAFVSIYNNNLPLAIALIIVSFVNFIARFIQQHFNKHIVSSSLVIYSLFILLFYLIYYGGLSNTGPLWIFLMPPVSLFLHGFKLGLLELVVFVVIISIMLFYPNNALLAAEYHEHFKSRLIFSFMATILLSGFYEYSRQKSYIDLKNLSIKYQALSKLDHLTQLSNRRDALNKIEYEQNKLKRSQKLLCVILCDIDFFKKVNDDYGHDAGDYILVELAKVFKAIVRKQDLVARWGGEEFLFLLPDTDLEGAQIITQKIHDTLAELHFQKKDLSLQLTVSMGIAEVDVDQDIQQHISRADENLYKAKVSGRNQTVC